MLSKILPASRSSAADMFFNISLMVNAVRDIVTHDYGVMSLLLDAALNKHILLLISKGIYFSDLQRSWLERK